MSATPRQRVLAVTRKELRDLRRNKAILGAMVALPLLFVTLMIAINAVIRHLPPEAASSLHGLTPPTGTVADSASILVLINDQFMFFVLLVPVILPTVIAAHSIVGEKQARTLEPLLATPVRTWELLVAKVAAAVVPAVLIGWAAYAVAVTGVLAASGVEVAHHLWRPLWSVGVPVLGPLLALCSTLTSVIISARVADVRTAQAISGVTALPLIGGGMTVIVAQTVLGTRFLLVSVAALVPLDVLLLVAATQLFEREVILTRWK
jgi:ABC-type Na+ efflux pump permease subunit